MPMNILRKLSTLIRAMASPDTGDRAADRTPAKDDVGPAPAAEEPPRAKGQRSDLQDQPLDRSRVADLLDQQASGQDMPTQRQKGDRS
jgi:hypothetical protein